MTKSVKGAFLDNFLGNSPEWYKITIIAYITTSYDAKLK